MTIQAAVAMGGNLGNVSETFQRALVAMAELKDVQVLSKSSDFHTRAIGSDAGHDYINAVVLLAVECSPLELLRQLQQIETDLGRVRTIHWGPRTLDLDILSYGGERTEVRGEGTEVRGQGSGNTLWTSHSTLNTQHSTLSIPHPACWYRRFVLDPWHEIDPDWVHPVLQETVLEMRERLLRRPLRVCLNMDEAVAVSLIHTLGEEFSNDLEFIPASGRRQSNYVQHEMCEDHNPPSPPQKTLFTSWTESGERAGVRGKDQVPLPSPLTPDPSPRTELPENGIPCSGEKGECCPANSEPDGSGHQTPDSPVSEIEFRIADVDAVPSPNARTVWLPADKAIETARQVLRAALDEPQLSR